MSVRTVFSEMPYACALAANGLSSRCSNCFVEVSSSSIVSCSRRQECPIVYCNQECRDIDRPNHQYECRGFEQPEMRRVSEFVRLLGRILTRRLVDGGRAHLVDGFPKHIPDRCLDDLMSHQREIEGCKPRFNDMESCLTAFGKFYMNTPLMDDWNLLRRTYCVMWINCFLVGGAYDMSKGVDVSLGVGFYLNVSRFNHSCSPDFFVDFDGARLFVQYKSMATDEAGIADEMRRLTGTADDLNNASISYGFSCTLSNDSFFPLREQRRSSLEFVYYFKCQCVLCGDETKAALEQHAAVLECSNCAEPYLWSKSSEKIDCRKSCACLSSSEEGAAVKKFEKSSSASKKLPDLEREWKKAMTGRMCDRFANELVTNCESALKLAIKLWHPSKNLRMAQLCERVFVSCKVLVSATQKREEKLNVETLTTGLDTGEILLGWSLANPSIAYGTTMAGYAYDLARLYSIGTTVAESCTEARDRWTRAAYWFEYAASIWALLGGKNGARFVRDLTAKAEAAKLSAADMLPVESSNEEETEKEGIVAAEE